ncbi:hypothetical protein BGZ89_009787 [Linnemannia elongata]|nr:hypothetical protein BGZ89_009787 [Linnemannia elongata]
MVVHTFGALNAEVNAILESHVAFNNCCVTKILVDSQGNGGGLISLSSNLVQMLFQSKQLPRDAYENNDLFNNPASITHNGRTALYSENTAKYF